MCYSLKKSHKTPLGVYQPEPRSCYSLKFLYISNLPPKKQKTKGLPQNYVGEIEKVKQDTYSPCLKMSTLAMSLIKRRNFRWVVHRF